MTIDMKQTREIDHISQQQSTSSTTNSINSNEINISTSIETNKTISITNSCSSITSTKINKTETKTIESKETESTKNGRDNQSDKERFCSSSYS